MQNICEMGFLNVYVIIASIHHTAWVYELLIQSVLQTEKLPANILVRQCFCT